MTHCTSSSSIIFRATVVLPEALPPQTPATNGTKKFRGSSKEGAYDEVANNKMKYEWSYQAVTDIFSFDFLINFKSSIFSTKFIFRVNVNSD